MYDLPLAIAIDIFTVLLCLLLLARHGRLAHSHPAVIYLFFHLYSVTTRLIAVYTGAVTLFNWGGGFAPVTPEEIMRAARLYDIAIVIMTVAWLKGSADDKKRYGELPTGIAPFPANLSLSHIWRVVVVAFPIGVFGLLFLSRIPGITLEINFGAWQRSTWLGMLPTWAGLALLALIYWYGFRKSLVLLMSLYLFVMVYQGFHRFRVIIPLILLAQIYLDRQQKRWPTVPVFLLLIVTGLLFFPLKQIGQSAQRGTTFIELADISSQTIGRALQGDADDQEFLDQFAAALTLIDENGKFFYGEPYLALLVLPIPRPLWPDKPTFISYLAEISRPWRPMALSGMIVTFLGEAYANFGYVGIVVIPFLLAYGLARLYFQAYRHPYLSVERFIYLLIASNLIQVYRDGLTSIVIFVFVNMMPLVLIILLHGLFPTVSKKPKRLVRTQPALRRLPR